MTAGTFTFLFTDIEGSSLHWERHPQQMRLALERHNAILRQAIAAHQGRVFRTGGDAFCAVFADAQSAVAAAAEGQQALYAGPWPPECPLRVRVALHSGTVELDPAGDYTGASLNRLGRLLPACHGGQTLLTQATEQLARDELPPGARLLDLGQHRFRDLANPERVFQLVLPGLPERFPPLKTLEAVPNNLPVQLTSFIGREAELAEVNRDLERARLLTLTGPGGTGKTRLALQATAGRIDSYPDGVWLVELAPLTGPDLVPQAIAAVLGLREKHGQPLLETLTEALRERRLLLLLDNCEHLIEACAIIVEALLRACPGLQVLVSSREALSIPGEVSYRVPALKLPAGASPEDLRRSEAACLFIERAQAVNSRFTITAHNAPAVAQICQRLDGIPLALELAAARIKLFSAEQIAARLDDRFRLLTGGSRTALPRQQTLQALVDWSHDLLTDDEKALFRRLSVFAGGWSFEAAEWVAGFPGNDLDTLDLLDSLVNKSLVLVDEQARDEVLRDEGTSAPDEAPRYRFLETVRQYASEKLLGAGESAQARARHLAYYTARGDQAWPQSMEFSPDRPVWMAWVEREIDNLRLAQDWALDHDLPAGLRLVTDLSFFLFQTGYAAESLRFTRQARKRAEGRPEFVPGADPRNTELLARSWTAEGSFLQGLGDFVSAVTAQDHAIQLARLIGSEEALARALAFKSIALGVSWSDDNALEATAEETTRLELRVGDPSLLVMALVGQSTAIYRRSGFAAARDRLNQVIADLDRAGEGYSFNSATARMALGNLAIVAGDVDEAEKVFTESSASFEWFGDRTFLNVTRSGLADVARLRGDWFRAIPIYQEVIAGWMKRANQGAVARCLECLAFIRLAQAKERAGVPAQEALCEAAILFGAAEATRTTYHAEMMPFEQSEYNAQRNELRERLAPSTLQTAWSSGHAMTLDQAAGYARDLKGF